MDDGMVILTEEKDNDSFQTMDDQQDEYEYMDISPTQSLETGGIDNNNLAIRTFSPFHSLSTSTPIINNNNNNISSHSRMVESINTHLPRSPVANPSHRIPYKRYSPRGNFSNVPAPHFVHSSINKYNNNNNNNNNFARYSQSYLIVSTTDKGYTLIFNRIWQSRLKPFSPTQWTTHLLNFIIYNRCNIIYVPNAITKRRVLNIIAKSVPVCLVPVPPHISHDSRKMASYIAYLINKHSIYRRNQPFYNSRVAASNRSVLHHYTRRPYFHSSKPRYS